MLIASVIVNVLLIVSLCVSVVFNYRLAKFAMAFEDNIASALDELDESYRNISGILETPLAYDSFEVRHVLAQINAARNTILSVARKIASRERSEE